MDAKTRLRVVINTLDKITVCGKKNLDYLLGSIQALEQIIRELEAKTDDDKPDQNKKQ